ncbi:hypothetical protein V1512DRAFT_267497 [Lipomyces arxii]|uniref:uncharacterized protein n=1 Tax=Lipomyces arxii TaxID=56418 RepID=UPI0034CDE1AD
MERKIAVITGANGGLGFGIGCRLLDEVPMEVPLTIVVTARFMLKAVETIGRLKSYAKERDMLTFDYVLLDLGSFESVIAAAGELVTRYRHIDYLFCNAGGGDFTGIDWFAALIEILRGPVMAFTHPHFKRERRGRISQDGVGWVFQINVAANYVLMKSLLSVLNGGGKVVLVSSIETEISAGFDGDDVQSLRSEQPYVESKKMLELMHYAIASKWEKEYGVYVYVTHPGICQTSIFAEHLNVVTTFFMVGLFYVVRWLGSPWHVISAYKGAIAAVWVATEADPKIDCVDGVVYGSACDKFGHEYVRIMKEEGDENDANVLMAELERIVG